MLSQPDKIVPGRIRDARDLAVYRTSEVRDWRRPVIGRADC